VKFTGHNTTSTRRKASKHCHEQDVCGWETVRERSSSNIQTGLWNLSGEEPSELLQNLSLEVQTGTGRN